MTRKRYDPQFKVSAAKVILAGEMTVLQLSRELGIKIQPYEDGQTSTRFLEKLRFPGTVNKIRTKTTRSRS